jgi:hypothetical protein
MTHVNQWTPSDWIAIVQLFGLVVLGVAGWWLRAHFVARTDYHALGARVDNHATRLTIGDAKFKELEDRIAAVPRPEAIAQLEIKLTTTNGKIDVLAAQLSGANQLSAKISQQVDRIDQWLRDQR